MSLRDLVGRLPVTKLPSPGNTGNADKAHNGEAVTALPPLPEKTQTPKAREAAQAAPDKGDAVTPELREELEERAAIIEHDGETEREAAEALAVRLVQCRSCAHFTPNPKQPRAGIGRCAVDGPALSMSPHRIERGMAAWPEAPRYCTRWRATA